MNAGEMHGRRRAPTWMWLLATLLLASCVLFWRLGALPIQVWDEARMANNALEMSRSGFSLVTTYMGTPDHWNTKPPLFVWLMALSIRVVGPNEWGVRLPSVLAALATVALMFAFCAWRLRRPAVGYAATLVLFAAGTFVHGYIRGFGNDYVQEHAARSGNYDAMLALWTTAYLLAAYQYLHDVPSRRNLWLALCALGIGLAFLTKTVQGLIFVPALALYAVRRRRMWPALRSPAFHASWMALAVIVAGYYLARERMDPGYFQAAMHNDVVGRYLIDDSNKGPFYYLTFFLAMAFGVAAVQLRWGRDESRSVVTYLAWVCAFYLAVISFSANKQSWYVVPVLPIAALILAIGVADSIAWLGPRVSQRVPAFKRTVNVLLVATGVAAGAVVLYENVVLVSNGRARALADDRNRVNAFLRGPAIQQRGPASFVVVQESYVPGGVPGDAYYVAPTLFYVTALRAAGRRVLIQPPSSAIPAEWDAVLVCGRSMREAVMARAALQAIETDGECGIYRVVTSA